MTFKIIATVLAIVFPFAFYFFTTSERFVNYTWNKTNLPKAFLTKDIVSYRKALKRLGLIYITIIIIFVGIDLIELWSTGT